MAKFEVAMVFGEDAVNAYNNGAEEWEDYRKNCGSDPVVRRSFGTKEELDAYRLGIEDVFGWLDYCEYEDE